MIKTLLIFVLVNFYLHSSGLNNMEDSKKCGKLMIPF